MQAAELLFLTSRLQQMLGDTGLGLGCEMIALQTMAVRLTHGISRRIRGAVPPVHDRPLTNPGAMRRIASGARMRKDRMSARSVPFSA